MHKIAFLQEPKQDPEQYRSVYVYTYTYTLVCESMSLFMSLTSRSSLHHFCPGGIAIAMEVIV